MKCAAILSVAVVMMMGQGADSLLGLLGGNSVLDVGVGVDVNLDLDAQIFAQINANVFASLEAAIVAGAVARAQCQALLGLKANLFNRLWIMIDANVNGALEVDELVDLELLAYIEGLVDVNAGASLDLDIGLSLGGGSTSQCQQWWGDIWSKKRLSLVAFFRRREELKKQIQQRLVGGIPTGTIDGKSRAS